MAKDQLQIKAELATYGIHDVAEVFHNLSFEELYKHETDPSLEGFSRGIITNTGAVSVDTGIFTGRSPKPSDLLAIIQPHLHPHYRSNVLSIV